MGHVALQPMDILLEPMLNTSKKNVNNLPNLPTTFCNASNYAALPHREKVFLKPPHGLIALVIYFIPKNVTKAIILIHMNVYFSFFNLLFLKQYPIG